MSISELQSQIKEICKEQGVQRLDLFGARSSNQEGNDYDFIADFVDFPPAEYSRLFLVYCMPLRICLVLR